MFSFLKTFLSAPASTSAEPQAFTDENETAYDYDVVTSGNDIFGATDMANGGDLDQFYGSSTAHLQHHHDDDQPF